MRTYAEKRWLPFTPEQLFALVADVESYPEFLPWCVSTRIVGRESESCQLVDMTVGFKMMQETYTSRVSLTPHSAISVESVRGPFRVLVTDWKFAAAPQGGTYVAFDIRFEFRSRLLQAMIGAVFAEACRVMVRSFEKRAECLYRVPNGAMLER